MSFWNSSGDRQPAINRKREMFVTRVAASIETNPLFADDFKESRSETGDLIIKSGIVNLVSFEAGRTLRLYKEQDWETLAAEILEKAWGLKSKKGGG